jgi:hypothetical protein
MFTNMHQHIHQYIHRTNLAGAADTPLKELGDEPELQPW